MNEALKNKRLVILLAVTLIAVLSIGVGYAYLVTTEYGEKIYTVRAGNLNLTLTEENEITIPSNIPTEDETGLASTGFTFTLENKASIATDYTIYLDDIELSDDETRMSDSAVRFSLDKNSTVGEAKDLTSTGTNPNRILDTGSLKASNKSTYTLRMWINYNATSEEANGKVFKAKLRVVAKQSVPGVADTLLADNPVQETIDGMFLYTSEGKQSSNGEVNSTYVTNGMYMMEDEDGESYYFRGNVDNIVQFGEYEADYYVYQDENGNQFQTLESCQSFNDYDGYSECNQVVKYAKGIPMYWRIVRVNGDGTLRLLYSGTSKDATGDDLMIGYSQYNTNSSNQKYTGYTYDNGTDSLIKKEVDTWYTNALSTSSYDKYVANGRFCSDSSGFDQEVYDNNYVEYFASYDRLSAGNPTLICPTTTESFGGSYTLKAGLMTADEMTLGGDKIYVTSNNYLSSGIADYWTMSPAFFSYAHAIAWDRPSNLGNYNVSDAYLRVRPVINVDVSNLKIAKNTDGYYVLSAK